MALAIFDLDNTLIGGDSDHLWGEFVCERGLVDSEAFAARNDQFYEDYKSGNLDIDAYLRFALAPLRGVDPQVLAAWHRDFMASKIEPIMLPRARQLIASHRERNHHLLVITATNEFITRPIAAALGIDDILACEAQQVNGRYTGEPLGTPSYHEGKVVRLEQWLRERDISLAGAYFYSDSHNDLPLLEQVDKPVAVDPDPTLLARAREAGWPVISLRD
ncbi:HAD-IB family hydrolase [Seongchinamella sediminis]|uniref:Histidinol-phosphatase n=1 Tax=Seongchinamella sediminis TaxID=2283635 RepID=A0A3L7E1U1_9GAMM|nr:HAD family hydrolase [Seongchinamella sediminis]RLQ23466.1 HAD-IB family hydrolase [Seongchinamella sediminis]